MTPDAELSEEERAELEGLAELVSKSDLCSTLFPFFVQSFQNDTGREPTGAVKRIASRIEKIDQIGLHLSPSIVAMVLRRYGSGNHD